ncbi:MAG: hypothetical protein AAF389_02295 [Gemmatimonadota bacterium]
MKGLVVYLAAIGIGAGVGAVGMGAYNVVVVGVEPVVADSTAVEGEPADTTGMGSLIAEGAEPLATDTTEAEEAAGGGEFAVADGGENPDVSPAGEADPVSAPPDELAEAPAPDPDSIARAAQNFQRLARIFSAMKPDEAAPVLAQLDDDQLEGILLAMQGRNAAPILAEMDPERAASISRRVLGANE